MKTIANRLYINGTGILNSANRISIYVLDVAGDKIVSTHQSAQEATEAMIRYAHAEKIHTLLAIASDFGADRPLVVTETY